ncbi:MAG: CRISPR-associated endonuclease Cas1 [Nostoc sp.]
MAKTKYQAYTNVPKPSPKLAEIIKQSGTTLYLDTGAIVQLIDPDASVLQITVGRQESIFKLTDIRAIIATEPEIKSSALTKILRWRIPVILFSQSGEFLGRIEPDYKIRADIMQFQAIMTDAMRVEIMQGATWGRLRRLRRFLQRSGRDGAVEISQASKDILHLSNCITNHDSIASLQGLIGQAMLIFYRILPQCINPDWRFTSRHDNSPVCRMLDFSEKLLEESIKNAVFSVGLNPNLGYWHQSHHQTKGLIADLTTEFQILAIACVKTVLNRGYVTAKDFNKCWDENTLPLVAAQAITRAYQVKMATEISYPQINVKCTYEDLFYIQSKQLILYLQGQIQEYYSPDLK